MPHPTTAISPLPSDGPTPTPTPTPYARPHAARPPVPAGAREAVASPVDVEPRGALFERGVSAHARHRGDHPALVFGDDVRSFGDLDERARRLAAVLSDRGAGPGHPVATVLPNGFEPFEVATAAAMLRAPYLPVNWHLKADELAYILEDAGVAVVVGPRAALTDEIQTAVDACRSRRAGCWWWDRATRRPSTRPRALDLDSGPGPELMFYTSGTTSRPKGVVHGALADDAGRQAGMEGQVALWGWTADDVYVMSGPAYHASHCGWALCALYIGATTVITERFEARLAGSKRSSSHRGTRSFMVPAHFIRILELPEDERAAIDTSSFSLIVHAAAPCPVVVKQRMMAAFPHTEIHELYGASEGGATRISPEEWRAHPGSVGRPWPGVEIRILDEDGEPVPSGEAGARLHPATGRSTLLLPQRRGGHGQGLARRRLHAWGTSGSSTRRAT